MQDSFLSPPRSDHRLGLNSSYLWLGHFLCRGFSTEKYIHHQSCEVGDFLSLGFGNCSPTALFDFSTDEDLQRHLNKLFNNEDARDIYYTFVFVMFYVVPWMAIMISFYLMIAIKLRTGKTPQQESCTTAARLKEVRAKATRNVIKMMIVTTVVFLFCWIAYFLAQVAFRNVPCSFQFWGLFLAHCNCAINPVLCVVFNTTVRRGIQDIARRFRTSHRHNCACDTFLGTIKERAL